MKYKNVAKGVFLSRPNRFIANVLIDGGKCVCHVKNTGRCKELLIENAEVFLERSDNPNRKTEYDLIAVKKGDRLINIDSQVPNKVAYDFIKAYFNDLKVIKRETKYKNSRFDFYFETENERAFLEVKGVTLENDGVVLFPDAPTKRGVKHLNELCECIGDGYNAYVLFVIQMKCVKYFSPNEKMHKEFASALKRAKENGVKILAVDCYVNEDEITYGDMVAIKI